jgi:hypothetical protein
VSSEEEYESGELDTSGSDEFSWHEGRDQHVDAWVSPGRPELIERLLFAFIEPSVPMAEVSPFIRNALRLVDPLLPVDLLPSSRGAMLLRCESMSARNSLHRHSPISLHGTQLVLQKPKETSNRFFCIPTWLAFVIVSDFPNEHWYEPKIKECFKGFSEVAEIDPECLTGENFASLRLLLVVNDRLEIPFEMRINPGMVSAVMVRSPRSRLSGSGRASTSWTARETWRISLVLRCRQPVGQASDLWGLSAGSSKCGRLSTTTARCFRHLERLAAVTTKLTISSMPSILCMPPNLLLLYTLLCLPPNQPLFCLLHKCWG